MKDLITNTHDVGMFNLPDEVYHSKKCPGISRSLLVETLKHPKAAKRFLEKPDAPNRSMELGSAIHAAILEPDQFYNRFIFYPDTEEFKDARSSKVRSARAAFEQEHPTKTILLSKDFETIKRVLDLVYNHPTAPKYLKGLKEKTFFWKDIETNALLRCKPDVVCVSEHALIDIKTTSKGADPTNFRRSMYTGQYHIQHSFYIEGVNEAVQQAEFTQSKPFLDPISRFIFMVIELDEDDPEIAFYELYPSLVIEGRILWRKALRSLLSCIEKNDWPSYPHDPQIIKPYGDTHD